MASLAVEIWSDVVCPWCYLGKRRFENALARFPHREEVSVRYRSFELDPTAPSKVEGTPAERLAAEAGLDADEAGAVLGSDRYAAEVRED